MYWQFEGPNFETLFAGVSLRAVEEAVLAPSRSEFKQKDRTSCFYLFWCLGDDALEMNPALFHGINQASFFPVKSDTKLKPTHIDCDSTMTVALTTHCPTMTSFCIQYYCSFVEQSVIKSWHVNLEILNWFPKPMRRRGQDVHKDMRISIDPS